MNKTILKQSIALFASLIGIWNLHTQIADAWKWFGSLDSVTRSMHEAGIWGPATLFILFVLQVFLAFIPGQALMVACGYLYGFWGGFLLSWLSLVAGGELAFVLARKYGRPFAERWIKPDILNRWDKTAEGQGIGFFSLMLVMPLVPNDAMCYVAGMGTITHRRFTTANLLGRGAACVLTSAAGVLGGSLSWQGWAVVIAIFVLIGVIWHLSKHFKSIQIFA